MNNDMLWLFKKGGSEKLIKKLEGLIKKLTNFEKRAAAGRKNGFVPLPGNEEDTLAEDRGTSTTIKRSGGQSKNLSQMISKHLPPEVKAFMKPGGYSKKLWGMALKHIPPEAKKFLKLGSGESITTRGITKKTGFIPLGRRQAKTRRIQAGPPSFMKGPHAQETQEQTAARYLREEEITQRGLAPDATEEERVAQQALEQRQRASSAGAGFISPTTFMKKKGLPRDLKQRDRSQDAPALFTKRGAAAMAPGPGSPEKSKRDLEYEKNIKGMGLDPEAEAWALKQIKGGPKAVRGRIAEMEAMAPTLFPDAAAVSQKTGKGAMQAAELKAAAGKKTGFVPLSKDIERQTKHKKGYDTDAAEGVLAGMGLSHLLEGPVVGPEPLTEAEKASGMTLDAGEAAAIGEKTLASMGLTLEEALAGKGPGNAPVIKDVPPDEDVRSQASNLFSLNKPDPKAAQSFDGLRMPKETDAYTDMKNELEKGSGSNDKPGDEVEKDISELQEEGKKTSATLIELEKKLAALEKVPSAETQGHNMPESQANRSPPESSTIDNLMNRTNKVVWSPL